MAGLKDNLEISFNVASRSGLAASQRCKKREASSGAAGRDKVVVMAPVVTMKSFVLILSHLTVTGVAFLKESMKMSGGFYILQRRFYLLVLTCTCHRGVS